ncbi:MAG: hypothetical protein NWF14_01645 [Candidatus Bathyarchaeota archaeon]|nr:hypothetical protein [Candidatus Bathyarchaeota archaeon]
MVEASLVNLVELGVLVVGVVIALQQLRDIQQTRQTELFMSLYNRFSETECNEKLNEFLTSEWDSLKDMYDKSGPITDPKTYSRMLSLLHYFEGIGVLVQRKQIDPDLVADLMSNTTLLVWNKFKPILVEVREVFQRPSSFEGFEYLAEQMMKHRPENVGSNIKII